MVKQNFPWAMPETPSSSGASSTVVFFLAKNSCLKAYHYLKNSCHVYVHKGQCCAVSVSIGMQ